MYDMYHWDRSAPATEDTAETNRAHASSQAAANEAGRAHARPPAAQAVQVALDRRDNGGDFRDPRDQ